MTNNWQRGQLRTGGLMKVDKLLAMVLVLISIAVLAESVCINMLKTKVEHIEHQIGGQGR